MDELDGRTKEGKLESRLKRLERLALFIEQQFKGDLKRWERGMAEMERMESERLVRRKDAKA